MPRGRALRIPQMRYLWDHLVDLLENAVHAKLGEAHFPRSSQCTTHAAPSRIHRQFIAVWCYSYPIGCSKATIGEENK